VKTQTTTTAAVSRAANFRPPRNVPRGTSNANVPRGTSFENTSKMVNIRQPLKNGQYSPNPSTKNRLKMANNSQFLRISTRKSMFHVKHL
jgi:hypothetical protein